MPPKLLNFFIFSFLRTKFLSLDDQDWFAQDGPVGLHPQAQTLGQPHPPVHQFTSIYQPCSHSIVAEK
jgi:hypothetical protein